MFERHDTTSWASTEAATWDLQWEQQPLFKGLGETPTTETNKRALLQLWYQWWRLPANAGVARDSSLIAGLQRCPGVGNGNPLRYSCLENFMDRGAWRVTVHGVVRSWTWLRTHTRTHPALAEDRELENPACLPAAPGSPAPTGEEVSPGSVKCPLSSASIPAAAFLSAPSSGAPASEKVPTRTPTLTLFHPENCDRQGSAISYLLDLNTQSICKLCKWFVQITFCT